MLLDCCNEVMYLGKLHHELPLLGLGLGLGFGARVIRVMVRVSVRDI